MSDDRPTPDLSKGDGLTSINLLSPTKAYQIHFRHSSVHTLHMTRGFFMVKTSNFKAEKMTNGLSFAEARRRLTTEGYNELPRQGQRTLFGIVLEVLREPMFLLLLLGGTAYLLLGDLQEALILLAFASLSIIITIIQETRTERVLETLRDLTSPRALVLREGVQRRIPGKEVVRGDIIILAEGDRVAADARLIESYDLKADESLLTGESLPVRKSADGPSSTMPRPGGDDLPIVYSGTLIVRGQGIAEVFATGPKSQIGKIGQSLHDLETEPPRLRLQTTRLVRMSGIAGGLVTLCAFALYGSLRGNWLEALLAAIAIGMSMLPEEFPVVLAVFMTMGAWRISRARVLTRKASAIEALGSATVLCTDKTGTLTENNMSIVELRAYRDGTAWRKDAHVAPSVESETLAFHGFLASAPIPFDPMETAFHRFSTCRDSQPSFSSPSRWTLIQAHGLRPDLLAVTNIWQPNTSQPAYVIATKGAPETIASLCRLQGDALDYLRHEIDLMAHDGLRVLGVAKAAYAGNQLPASVRDFDFVFLGLVGLADPVRPSVPAAVRNCQDAGIRVLMITGDYPATACAIARQAGLANKPTSLNGAELESLTEDELQEKLRDTVVFARIMPEQKLRIVQTLKADNQIVAMTGDGVNDAPSLKAAHIGIAMGGRGTDVAREAAAIVLLDDDFSAIVAAIRLGRRIYDNLRKALGFIFAVHVPIAGLALMPLILGLPVILSPIHIAFLEMIIDPVCTLVFEAEIEEDDIMRRPPRSPEEPLFSWSLIAWSLMQGTTTFVAVGLIYLFSMKQGMPENEARAFTFIALVLSITALILVNRSFSTSLLSAILRPNLMLAGILALVAVALTLSQVNPVIRDLFRFGFLHWRDIGIAAGVAIGVLGLLEVSKIFWRGKLTISGCNKSQA